MKLLFEFDTDKKKVIFFGNGFEISSHAETYEDIAEFAKQVIENDIGIPKLKHREKEEKTDKDYLISLLLNYINNSKPKNYYIKNTGELYKGQIVLNCGKITDNKGNELVFM